MMMGNFENLKNVFIVDYLIKNIENTFNEEEIQCIVNKLIEDYGLECCGCCYLEEKNEEKNEMNEKDYLEYLENNKDKIKNHFKINLINEMVNYYSDIEDIIKTKNDSLKIDKYIDRLFFYKYIYELLIVKNYLFKNKKYIKLYNIILNKDFQNKNKNIFEKDFELIEYLWNKYIYSESGENSTDYNIVDMDELNRFIDDIDVII